MPLSDGQQKLLLFSEQDPESSTDIPDELLEGIHREYEKKIIDVLRAAYERDRDNLKRRSNPRRDAYVTRQRSLHTCNG